MQFDRQHEPSSRVMRSPTIMNESNEPYSYSAAPTNTESNPHLSNYWNQQQWQHNATVTNDVPTISVESTFYEQYPAPAYSPEVAGPGTPSEDGTQSPEFNLNLWNMPMGVQYQQQTVQPHGTSFRLAPTASGPLTILIRHVALVVL